MQGRTKVSIFLSLLLLPISGVWWIVLRLRHFFYDFGILRSQPGAIPTVVLGNLAVGGTGKTPHAIAFLKLLSKQSPVFLSRGYGRKSKGYVRIKKDASVQEVGDEPLLVFRSMAPITAAVCEDRLEGVRQLKAEKQDTGCAVLDDAFQHRRLQGDVNVVLTTFDEPYFDDYLLPAGRLRDVSHALNRAHAVIVTKCPSALSAKEKQRFEIAIAIRPLFFTSLRYSAPVPLHAVAESQIEGAQVIAVAGIARPQPFFEYLEQDYHVVQTHEYRDHQPFSDANIQLWRSELDKFAPTPTVIVTTEKDAMRLLEMPAARHLPIYYVPIEVQWEEGDEERMRSLVLNRLKGNGKL